MDMTKGILSVTFSFIFFLVCVSLDAQTQSGAAYGAYSPYSVFGVGDIAKEGSAYNKSMGGVGIANRNRRYINYMNPAAISSIDSSSFMADFGVMEKNVIFDQNLAGRRLRSGNNTFNIYNFVINKEGSSQAIFIIKISTQTTIQSLIYFGLFSS